MKLTVKKISAILLVAALCVLPPACQTAAGTQKSFTKTSFVTLWLPQAQFAGYYVAQEKGFYKKHGLDVTIVNGGPDNPPFQLLEDGKADFCVMWLSTAIQKRSQGIRLVNIAQILQKSGLMLIAKKSSGILKPEDMNHKKVGLWDADFEIQPQEFFKKYNLTVRVVPQSYTVNLFLQGGVDVASAMWYNEYHTIINAGYDPDELTTFFFYDYGLNSPEDGIYTLEDTIQKDPALCEAFVAASLEGWRYAFEHIEESVDIVLQYMAAAHVPATRVHQKWQLERMRDLASIGGNYKNMGMLSVADFDRVASGLKKDGLIPEIPAFDSFRRECAAHDKN